MVELKLENSVVNIMEIKKSAWKKEVKEKIGEVVANEVNEKSKKLTKLRFTGEFGKKEYVENGQMRDVKEITKLRLNMCELKSNFKGKYRDETCPACGEEKETTKHVIRCEEYRRLTGHNLHSIEPVEQLMNNTGWLIEASKVYQQIEEIRKWLVV